MKNDPFVELLEAVSEAGAAAAEKGALRFIRATVLTVNPITLDVCGTQQEASRVHVCSHLMDGYSETMNGGGAVFRVLFFPADVLHHLLQRRASKQRNAEADAGKEAAQARRPGHRPDR